MSDFCGTYTLVDNTNMKAFATVSFPNALTKIAFHSGIVSTQLYNLLGKTLCQLLVRKDTGGQLVWTLTFDKEPHKGKDGHNEIDDTADDGGGMVFRIHYRLGEEFLLTIPISGEKSKSMVKRKSGNVTALEQITHFATGDVETIYTRTETELRLYYLHKPSGTKASQIFKRNACFE